MNDEIAAMEAKIHDRLSALCVEFEGEYSKLYEASITMSGEAAASPFYKTLKDHISSVEAVLITLEHTLKSFPVPPKKALQ